MFLFGYIGIPLPPWPTLNLDAFPMKRSKLSLTQFLCTINEMHHFINFFEYQSPTIIHHDLGFIHTLPFRSIQAISRGEKARSIT